MLQSWDFVGRRAEKEVAGLALFYCGCNQSKSLHICGCKGKEKNGNTKAVKEKTFKKRIKSIPMVFRHAFYTFSLVFDNYLLNLHYTKHPFTLPEFRGGVSC